MATPCSRPIGGATNVRFPPIVRRSVGQPLGQEQTGCTRPNVGRSKAQFQFLIADVLSTVHHPTMIAFAMLLAAPASIQICDLAAIQTARAAHYKLAHRAVEVIAAASTAGPKADARLHHLVDEAAIFSLGAGDVGRPQGTGIEGARSLAVTMNADQYRFLGWDYMDRPADGCGKQTVTVNFISTGDRRISEVKFSFDHGRVVTAEGWQRSFESGSILLPASAKEGS